MVSVGIIANPASGKDIRRLVAHSITFNNQEKVNIVQRAILGLNSVGVEELIYMPDYYNIVPRAMACMPGDYKLNIKVIQADMVMNGIQEDSADAARLMRECHTGCIITLGGDGTNRMVAKTCGDVPVLPISTGTNNVFPRMLEGTGAGMAAGVVARGLVNGSKSIQKNKKLKILKEGTLVDIALIDAVVLKDIFIGSRAIWDAERIKQVVVTRGEPDSIGISAIAGNLEPIGTLDEYGMAIEIGQGGDITIMAPIAPGLIRPVPIRNYRLLNLGEEVKVSNGPGVIALDGEREIEVGENDEYFIQLTLDGPNVVNVRETLREAVQKGYSRMGNL